MKRATERVLLLVSVPLHTALVRYTPTACGHAFLYLSICACLHACVHAVVLIQAVRSLCSFLLCISFAFSVLSPAKPLLDLNASLTKRATSVIRFENDLNFHTHQHTCVYIGPYVDVCMCACACRLDRSRKKERHKRVWRYGYTCAK